MSERKIFFKKLSAFKTYKLSKIDCFVNSVQKTSKPLEPGNSFLNPMPIAFP